MLDNFYPFCWHSRTQKLVGIAKKQTRPSTKQDFSGEALSKQNTKASLASLSCNSSPAPTEWSVIFAFGVWDSCKVCHQSLVSFDPSIISKTGQFLKHLLLVKLREKVMPTITLLYIIIWQTTTLTRTLLSASPTPQTSFSNWLWKAGVHWPRTNASVLQKTYPSYRNKTNKQISNRLTQFV